MKGTAGRLVQHMMTYRENYKRWLEETSADPSTQAELASLTDENEMKMRFDGYMTFGTGGLRAIMGAGSAYMNLYTVAHATEGLARLILQTENGARRGVAVCYDSRNNSREFARRAAEVLSAGGIRVYLFPEARPTPVLSFAVRHLGCIAGINVTASHNPARYNGYKVYWEDGGQLPPQHASAVSREIARVDIFRDVPPPARARKELITVTGAELDNAYAAQVLAQSVSPDAIPAAADKLAVVYTPLHGTGGSMVPRILRAGGVRRLYTVDAQMKPDGDFPTVPFPNPEFPEAFALGQQLAEAVGSDLIIATDPDADRVGVMAKDKSGTFRCITGNQMGALLLEYICTALQRDGGIPEDAYAVKTIVTSELAGRICAAHGVKMYNVLTGFKFIGEIIRSHEEAGRGTYLLGFEESYGYLKGTYARDKDAVVTSLLICEMAAHFKARNMTLLDALEELFAAYGQFREGVFSIAMEGADGQARMTALMDSLRQNPPKTLGAKDIAVYKDFKTQLTTDRRSGETSPTGLPISDVLYYRTEDENIAVIRPSGTEPKIKVYVLCCGDTPQQADENVRLCTAAMKELLRET